MSRIAPALCALALLCVACGDEPYERVGPHTDPAVDVSYPKYYREKVNTALRSVTFSEASADLPVTIVGLEDLGRDHVIDFGLPEQAVMTGYGAYQDMTEQYHRTRLRDSNGVHGVRVSVYRTDSKRGHTNVWSHFLARADDADVFLTEQSQWDWIGGEQDTSDFSQGAWPFYEEVQRSHYFYDSFFGFTPGIYSRTEFIRQVIVSTYATSPTYGLENCVQVLFNAIDPALRHQAFLHERYGLVEVVYRWHDLDSTTGNDYPLVPIDGFAAPPSTLQELPPQQTTYNDVQGTWRGSVELEDEGEEGGASITRTIQLEFKGDGLAYRALSDSYDVDGTYQDGDVKVHLRGRYHRATNLLTLVAGRTGHLISIYALYDPFEGADGGLEFVLYRTLDDGSQRSAEGALVRTTPTRSSL